MTSYSRNEQGIMIRQYPNGAVLDSIDLDHKPDYDDILPQAFINHYKVIAAKNYMSLKKNTKDMAEIYKPVNDEQWNTLETYTFIAGTQIKEEVAKAREQKLEADGWQRLCPAMIRLAIEKGKRLEIDSYRFANNFMGSDLQPNHGIYRPIATDDDKYIGVMKPRCSTKYYPWDTFWEAWCRISNKNI